jgi:hypothetical protein
MRDVLVALGMRRTAIVGLPLPAAMRVYFTESGNV